MDTISAELAALGHSAFARFTRIFEPGGIIFAEFEPGDTFYLIRKGRVKLVSVTGDVEKTLNILQPSEMFGEMALLEDSPRTATAIALDQLEVLEFNRENFALLMYGNPRIALRLLRALTRRLHDAKRKFAILSLKEPQARIADVFLMLDENQADIDRTTDAREFQTTVENIAHWAGMGVMEAREIIGRFVLQDRMALVKDRIVVTHISELSRYVSSRRKQLV